MSGKWKVGPGLSLMSTALTNFVYKVFLCHRLSDLRRLINLTTISQR